MKIETSKYKDWIVDLKSKIQQSQIKAAIKVNSALIELYWELGKEIAEKEFENQYGSGFFEQLSQDLKIEFSQITGFSARNLKYFKNFYQFYSLNNTIRQQVVAELKSNQKQNRQQAVADFENEDNKNLSKVDEKQFQKLFLIPWGHHIQIFTKCKNVTEALFYINKTIENGWSRAVLLNMISETYISLKEKQLPIFLKRFQITIVNW